MRTRTKGNPTVTNGISDALKLKVEQLRHGEWKEISHWYPLNRPGLADDYKVCRDELHPGPPYKTGGPLNIWHIKANYQPLVNSGTRRYDSGTNHFRLVGGFSFHNNFAGAPALDLSDDIERGAYVSSTYGTKAWNKFRPARPEAGASQFIAELRDLPRMLKTTSSIFYKKWRDVGGKRELINTPRSVANHWLNTQFGWLPFVSDIQNFVHTVKHLSRKIDQLKRDNGQWILREGSVSSDGDTQLVSSSTTQSRHWPLNLGSAWIDSSKTGSHQLSHNWESKVSFTARFKYWLPQLTKPDWQGYAGRRLLGLEITPTLIWELTPWSWLVDWFAGLGDSLQLAESIAQDNLCAKYCYLKERRTQYYELFSTIALKQGSEFATFRYTKESKIRTGASPFGFGLEPVDFSARQWSILGALGLTRLR